MRFIIISSFLPWQPIPSLIFPNFSALLTQTNSLPISVKNPNVQLVFALFASANTPNSTQGTKPLPNIKASKSAMKTHTLSQIKLQRTFTSAKTESKISIGSIVNDRKKQLKELIENTKASIIGMVDSVFQEVLTNIENSINDEEKLTGYHTSYKIEMISSQITRQITEITQYARDLNSTHFLSSVKKLKKQEANYFKTNYNRVNEEIKCNQIFQPSITFHKEKIQQIQASIRQIFTLNFTYPPQLQKHAIKTPQPVVHFVKTLKNDRFVSPHKNVIEKKLTSTNCSFFSQPVHKQSMMKTFHPAQKMTIKNTSTPIHLLKTNNVGIVPNRNNSKDFVKNQSEMKKMGGLMLTKNKENNKLKVDEEDLAESMLISNIR